MNQRISQFLSGKPQVRGYFCPGSSNGMYGTIRMHQERQFPGRVIATISSIPIPPPTHWTCGHEERVERTQQFPAAFKRGVVSGKPAILHCLLDPNAITPSETLEEISEGAVRRRLPAPAPDKFLWKQGRGSCETA